MVRMAAFGCKLTFVSFFFHLMILHLLPGGRKNYVDNNIYIMNVRIISKNIKTVRRMTIEIKIKMSPSK